MTEQESEWASEVIAQARRDHKTILALRDQLDKVRDELEAARADTSALNYLLEEARRERDDAWSGRDIGAVYDELVKVQDELAELRAELKRYTDVYADPDGAPLPISPCEAPDERPLKGVAAAAQLRIDAMLRGEEAPSWADALKHPSDEEVAP